MKALITEKVGMATIYTDKGAAIAVTLLSANPNVVTQLKSDEKDGYNAIQLGFGESKKNAKAQTGHLKNAKTNSKYMREFIIDDKTLEINIGDQLAADVFSVGDNVDVTGISKGKGFAGTIKRHNFHRGRKTHGGRSYRRPGSIGSQYPQRIFPGKKMAGQMGAVRVTTKNLTVALVDTDKNVIAVQGSIPGPKKGLVLIKGAK